MDPLSITASVVGLTATCVQTAKALNDIKDKFQHASLTISAICTETTIISASLSRIQSSILASPDALSEKLKRPDLETTLDTTLTGCFIVFDVLQTEIQKVMESFHVDEAELSFKGKLRYVWSESMLKDILSQIRGLQTALTLLLQLLGTDTMAELKQIMENNTTVLANVVERTSKMRTSRAPKAPQSIFDMSFTTQSIYSSDSSSLLSSTLFSFDDEVVTSQAYRRILAKAYGSSDRKPSHSSDNDDDKSVDKEQEQTSDSQPRDIDHKLEDGGGVANIDELAEDTQALTITSTPILGPTPTDPLLEFVQNENIVDESWENIWSITVADIETVPKKEMQRQIIMHEVIMTEVQYLRSLEVMRYLYKYRWMLDTSVAHLTLGKTKIRGLEFPGFEDIHHVNKTLLYDPMKERQKSEGPWLSNLWDIFTNWLGQAAPFYASFSAEYSFIVNAIRQEAKRDPRFSHFLDQGRNHRRSQRLDWNSYLKGPITRLQRYYLLLTTVLKYSDRQNPRHKYMELSYLIEELKKVALNLDENIGRSNKEIDSTNLRASIASTKIDFLIPETGAVIAYRATMLNQQSRFRAAISSRGLKSEVELVLFSKPSLMILLLAENGRRGMINQTLFDVVLDLQEPLTILIGSPRKSLDTGANLLERPWRMPDWNNNLPSGPCVIDLDGSSRVIGREVNSRYVTVIAPSHQSAKDFGDIVKSLGGVVIFRKIAG